MRLFRERRRPDRRAPGRQTGGRRKYDKGRKRTLLGLDWRGRTLRFVELEHFKNNSYLLRAGRWDLPKARDHTALMSEINRNRISESINEMISSYGIKSKDAVLALESRITKIIRTPVEPDWNDQQMFDEAARKVSESTGQPIDNWCIDYHIVPNKAGNPSIMIVGAVEKQIVDSCRMIIAQAGLNLVILDVDCFAIQNAYELNAEKQDERVSVVTEITAEIAEIVVLYSSEFKAGQILNMPRTMDEMIDHEAWSQDKADLEILSHRGNVYLTALARALLKRANGLVRSAFPGTEREGKQDMVLCGTGARFQELTSYLQSHHEGSVNVLNPFTNIKVSKSFVGEKYIFDEAPEYAVAVGLASRQEY